MLKDGDVVKVQLGIQIDGYAVIHAETVQVGSKTEGAAADAIKAAYEAAQAAIRTLKPGAKNWDVTEVVQKVTKEYGVLPVQGMLSCQHEQNVTDGKKRVLLNPTPELRRDHETATFEEGEVYGVDVLVVTGTDAKVGLGAERESLMFAGPPRGRPYFSLQARQRCQLPAQDEDFARYLLRGPEEVGCLPLHPPCPRGRAPRPHGCPGGCCPR